MRLTLSTLALMVVACGPIRSSSTIVDAAAEIAAAETSQGRSLSPYELVAAEAYLHKAREQESYSDFEVAEKLARKARDCARVARVRAERLTRTDLGVAESAAKTDAQCYAGPPGARPVQGVEALAAAAKPGAAAPPAPAAPGKAKPITSPAPADPGAKKKKPVKPRENEPADPLPEGE